jgi:cytoskeletal protein RodZ
MRRTIFTAGLFFMAVVMVAAPLPQGQGQSKKDDKQQQQQKKSDRSSDQKKQDDDGLSTGTIQASGSKKSADTATLGFKGVGPDGQIDPAKLAENPTAQDEMLVTQIQQIAVAGDDLKEFIKDGSLKGR